MADGTFDAVVVGGGTKDLFLAMYLSRYTGTSVDSLYEQWKLTNRKIGEIPRKKE
jgi:hypothetical protein